ncbi:TetR/AcrR family transcriptional regulator [Sodalis ligni]|jgi:AcrR family transcriptional regulator|uniref:TetR family transcriptional regulator n=1 Tax=Sodalis ligni TaxID=2697027 RepID=A0A4R1NF00_9GAMM|nr:TetR/AcrR family transcriptional regulator [Sodalis ligni]TCL06224.1 TetR family transcriptional regulator [Sodalis ligni]
MARPKSDDKRSAIMDAAIRIIATRGVSAPTALIAKEAGVSNGSLFTYFGTKAELLNQLYLELKTEMASATMGALPTEDIRSQMASAWFGWIRWAVSNPNKHRTLAHLAVSGEISEKSRESGNRSMAGIGRLLDQSRANGVMRDAPLALVAGVMGAVAETTVDYIIKDPANADAHCAVSFDAIWRMLH